MMLPFTMRRARRDFKQDEEIWRQPLKGAESRDYNWLIVVWYDGSWFLESGQILKNKF
jgi:hypothetical protein